MATAIDIVDQLVEELKSLQPLKSVYQEKLDKKFRLEFNYNSNHLEGNTLTYGETELLLIFDDTKGNHSLREYEEMKAHDVAYKIIEDWAKDKERPLTEQSIKNLNEIILVRPYWKEAQTIDGQDTRRQIKVGDYKQFPSSVRLANGEIFNYTSPTDTPIEMQELIEWYRTEEDHLHPVTLAAMLHYKFVRIHPFDDGNGRISRLLVNYVLLKNDLPPVIIKSSDKQNYLRALHLADIGDYEPFITYIGEQLIWSLEICIKAGKGESIEEQDDFLKEISLWKKKLTKNKIETKAKSDDFIVEIYIKGLNSILNLYLTKMEDTFSDLFTEWKVLGFVNNSNINNRGLDYIEERMQKLSEYIVNPKEEKNYKDEIQINSLHLTISMNGFNKDGTNTFNTSSSLEVNFKEFKYQIKFGSKSSIEKLYGEWINKEEEGTIVKIIIKDKFQDIKLKMTNPTLSDLFNANSE